MWAIKAHTKNMLNKRESKLTTQALNDSQTFLAYTCNFGGFRSCRCCSCCSCSNFSLTADDDSESTMRISDVALCSWRLWWCCCWCLLDPPILTFQASFNQFFLKHTNYQNYRLNCFNWFQYLWQMFDKFLIYILLRNTRVVVVVVKNWKIACML